MAEQEELPQCEYCDSQANTLYISIIEEQIASERSEISDRIFDSMYKNPCVIVHLFDGQTMRVEVGNT